MTIRKVTTLTSGLVTLAELRTGQTFIGKVTTRQSGLRAQDVSGILIPKASIADTALIRAAKLVDLRNNVAKLLEELLGIGSNVGLLVGKPVLDVLALTDIIELIKRTAPERSFDEAALFDDIIGLLIEFNRNFNEDLVLEQRLSLALDRHLEPDTLVALEQISLGIGPGLSSAQSLADQLVLDLGWLLQDDQSLQSRLGLTLTKPADSTFEISDAAQTLAGITKASEIIVTDLQTLSNSIRLRDNSDLISQLAQAVSKATADLQIVESRPSLQPGPGLSSVFSMVSDPISWFMNKVLADEQPVPDFIGVFDGLNYSFAFAVQDRPVILDVFSRSFNRQFNIDLEAPVLERIAKLLSKPAEALVSLNDASSLQPNLGLRERIDQTDVNRYLANKTIKNSIVTQSNQYWDLYKIRNTSVVANDALSQQYFKTRTSEYIVNDILVVKPGKGISDNANAQDVNNLRFDKFNRSLVNPVDLRMLDFGKSLDEILYTIGEIAPGLPAYNTYARNSIPVASSFGVSVNNTNLFIENNQSAGRFVFTGQLSPRVLTLQPLPAVTNSRLDVTLIAGTASAVNGLEQPDAGEDLVLQYSTNGSTWTTSCTLWAGGTDWIGTVGVNGTYTTSITFTSATPVDLSWRFIQTNFSNPGFDQYAIVNITAPHSGAINNMVLQDYVLITDTLTGPVEPRVYILDQDRWFFDKPAQSQTQILDLLQFRYNYEFLGDTGQVFMLDEIPDFLFGKSLRSNFALASRIAMFFNKVLADSQNMLDLAGIFDGLNYASVINKVDAVNYTDNLTRTWSAFTRYQDQQAVGSRIRSFDMTKAGFPFQDTQSFGSFIQIFKAVLRNPEDTILISDATQDVIGFIRRFPLYSLNSEFGVDNSNIQVGTNISGIRVSGDTQENLSYILSARAYQDIASLTIAGWGTSITRNARSTDWFVAGDPTAISPRLLHPTTTQSRVSGATLENFSYELTKSAQMAGAGNRTVTGWGTSITRTSSSGDFVVIGDPTTTSSGQSRRSGSTLENFRYTVGYNPLAQDNLVPALDRNSYRATTRYSDTSIVGLPFNIRVAGDDQEKLSWNFVLDAKAAATSVITRKTIDGLAGAQSSVAVTIGPRQRDETGVWDFFQSLLITNRSVIDSITVGNNSGFRTIFSENTSETVKFLITKLIGDEALMIDLANVFDGLVYTSTILTRDRQTVGSGATVANNRFYGSSETLVFDYIKNAKLGTAKTVIGWGTSVVGTTSTTDFVVIGDPSTTSSGQSRRGGSAQERVFLELDASLKDTATDYNTNILWDVILPGETVPFDPLTGYQYSPYWYNNSGPAGAFSDVTEAETVAHRITVPIYWNSSQTATITAAASMGLRSLTSGSLISQTGGYYGPFDLGFDFYLGGARYRHVIVRTDGALIFNSSLTSVALLNPTSTIDMPSISGIGGQGGPAFLTTIGLTNSLGATVTSNINIYDSNNPAATVTPAVYTTAGTTTATGGLGNSRIFRVQLRTYDYNEYLANVGQLRVADGGTGTSNFTGIIAEYRFYQQVATGLQTLEFIADYDYSTSNFTGSALQFTPAVRYAQGQTIVHPWVRDDPPYRAGSALMWSDARGIFLTNGSGSPLFSENITMGGTTMLSGFGGGWGSLAGSILQGTLTTNTSYTELFLATAGYAAGYQNLMTTQPYGSEILPNAQNDNLPAFGLGAQVFSLDPATNNIGSQYLIGTGGAETKFVDWLGTSGFADGARANYIHVNTQDYYLDRTMVPGGRYWASMFVCVPPINVMDPEWTKRGIGFEISTVNKERDYTSINSSTISRIMVPIAHSSATVNVDTQNFTVQRSLVTSAIQSVRALYTTAVLVRTSSATTNFGSWWRIGMLFQAHSSLTTNTDAFHVRLQTDSYANNVLNSSISAGAWGSNILIAGLQIAPAKSFVWPPDYLSTVEQVTEISEITRTVNSTTQYSLSSGVQYSNRFMYAVENIVSSVNVSVATTEWRFDNLDQRSGRWIFSGGSANAGRFLYMAPLTNVTASTARVTFVAGDSWTVSKSNFDNNLVVPEAGDSLLLQYSTNGSTWVTARTLWDGSNWGTASATNAPRTSSATFTTSVASNLQWRIAQTTHSAGQDDEYGILVFETDNNQGTEARYPRFIDLQLRENLQLIDRSSAFADFAPRPYIATLNAQAYQPGIFDTLSRRITNFLTPTGPGQMSETPVLLDDPVKTAYYYRTLPQFDQNSSETIILDQIFFANLLFKDVLEFPGDLDPFGNINTLESRGQLRMTDYVADIDYLESDYVGETRSIS